MDHPPCQGFYYRRRMAAMPGDAPSELERLLARREELLQLQAAKKKKLEARPHDYGIRAWWGFVIVGLLVGWMRAATIASVLRYGFVFWIAGMFFSIFALDSAEVQSKIAIFANKLGACRIAAWLYQRALTIR
jgi:hypothetical protein